MKNKIDFEEAVKDLEQTIEKLDKKNISIDEAIRLHDESLKKYEICEEILKSAEQKIEVYKK